MTKEEFILNINAIRTAQTDVERNNILLTLTADYETVLATASETASKVTQLENDNTEYAKLNNKLFLQLGGQEQQNQQTAGNVEQQNTPPPKRNVEDLQFD